MTNDPEYFDIDADDRALALHEAGHAVVAHATKRQVKWIEVRFASGGGKTETGSEEITIDKALAICFAGSHSEKLFGVATAQIAIRCEDDVRVEQRLLAVLPERERLDTCAKGYRLADVILKANADVVRRIAEELLARRWKSADAVVRIEGNELATLLGG
jgi:hypothetical protein